MRLDIEKFIANDILKTRKKKKSVLKSEPIKCRECGRTGGTLRKCSDGLYICNDCLNKE